MDTSATQLSDEQLAPPPGAGFVGFFWGVGEWFQFHVQFHVPGAKCTDVTAGGE